MIQDDLGAPGLEFCWNDTPTVDPMVQARIDDLAIRNGSMSINEVRARRGMPPLSPSQIAAEAAYGFSFFWQGRHIRRGSSG